MARITREAAEQYSSYDFNYFSLPDDGDFAEVRLMYSTLDDIQPDGVHTVKIDGKDKFVDCLRQPEDPLDKCPLCKAALKPSPKVFIELFVLSMNINGKKVDKNQIAFWTRGISILKDLDFALEDYKGELASNIVKIVRKGKKGSTDTKYFFKIVKSDDTTLNDLPEDVELRGDKALIIEKTAAEMDYFLDHDEFKKESAPSREESRGGSRRESGRGDVRRRGTSSRQSSDNDTIGDEEIPF